jgi:cytochrome o ubiquinol oxidase operon protein cyoD
MKKMKSMNGSHGQGTFASYLTGFLSSLVLTLIAFGLAELHIQSEHSVISHGILFPAILGLALIQLIIQLVFFLHLHKESGPRWNLAIFLSTITLVLLVIVGSLWIMAHLNYNMTPSEMLQYIENHQGGI